MEPNSRNSDGIRKQQPAQSIFSDKDTLIRRLEKERDILGLKLRDTLDKSRALHEKLAELDIARKIEVTDLNNEVALLEKEVANLSEDKESLLGENEMLLCEIADREKKIGELSLSAEVNDLQFREFRSELLAAASRIRELECRREELEAEYLSLISGISPAEAVEAEVVEAEAVEAEAGTRAEALVKEAAELRSVLAEKAAETDTLRQYVAHLNAALVRKDREAEEKSRMLSDAESSLVERDGSLRKLEEQLSRTREELEGAFRHRAAEVRALREQHEAEMERLNNHRLTIEAELETIREMPASEGGEALRAELNREKAKASALLEALTQKDSIIGEISERLVSLRADAEAHLKEKANLENMLNEAEGLKESYDELSEKAKSTELSLAHEKAMRERGELELAEFRRYHISEMDRAASERAKAELEAASLSEALSRERSILSEAKADFEKALAMKDSEIDGLGGSVERLIAGNEDLNISMAGIREEIKDRAVWLTSEREKLESGLASQMQGLEDMMAAFGVRMEERMRGYEVLLEKISAGLSAPQEEHVPTEASAETWGGKRQARKVFAPLVLVAVILSVAIGLYINRDKLAKVLPSNKLETVYVQSPWASGIKHERAGGMDIRLTFLNREALGVLGISDFVGDGDLDRNYYLLLEIKSEKGCIPPEFDSPEAMNVSFISVGGAAVPAVVPPSLQDAGRYVYRSDACVGEPGPVSLRRYLTVGRQHEIRGLNISGLSQETPLITIE